jgi:hypothetical protein
MDVVVRTQVKWNIWLAAICTIGSIGYVHAQVVNSRANEQVHDDIKLPVWQDANAYLKFLVPAAINAATIVAASGDSIFTQGVTIQSAAPKPAAVAVLFVGEASYPERMRATARHSPCQVLPQSKDSNLNSKYAIACNPDFLRKLDILIRVSHATAYINAQMRNDWTLMQLIKRIESEPGQVMAEAKPNVDDDHMSEHMSFLLAFLLGHESWHLQQHTSSTFAEARTVLATDPESDLDSRIMCRNYQEFARQGVQLDIMKANPVPLKEEGTTRFSDDRKYFDETRAIWGEELDADRYGAGIIANSIIKLRSKVKVAEPDLRRVYLETMENFALLMFVLWQGQLQPFAEENCMEKAGRDFYLTLCMCQRKELYNRAVRVFGATHPPIVLRMHLAAKEFTEKLTSDKDIKPVFTGTSRDLEAARTWIYVMGAMMDAPLKLAWPACYKEVMSVVADDGQLVQILPDLAGVLGPKASRVYPGYPVDEGALRSQCIHVPTTSEGQSGNRAAHTNPESATVAVRLSSFRISIMSAIRCIVEWDPKEPDMSEATLASHGVGVTAVKSAIAKISAAILKRNPENVTLLTGEKSDVMPGAAYRLSSLGVNDRRYDTFHIYVTETGVHVLLFKEGNYAVRVSPDQIGIDWHAFRDGVAAALENLYLHQYKVEFGDVDIKAYKSGEWYFSVPYMLRESKGP